ncbi:MAG: hypothetical protein U9R26_03030, partial [Campylobacterota bacterium]|nr:hypothetical protein [Campylobacterota bacterium]
PIPDPPGRTFKRILTGNYFGCEDGNADENSMAKAKQGKIDQIAELGLKPMFIRYFHRDQNLNREVYAAHVSFQREVSAERWNMTHVTEISFIVYHEDFAEFEKLSGVNLKSDFRNLTPDNDAMPYNGEERRKTKRETMFNPD